MTSRTLLPFDPDLVAPWTLGDGRRGALLLHGFAGTPPELRGLGEHLARSGWRCSGPALPGHATTPEDLTQYGWRDWAAAAQHQLDVLCDSCDVVVVAGQSMGGAMALHLAAQDMRIAAVATLAAPLWFNGTLVRLLPILQHLVRWHYPGDDVDLWDPTGVELLHSYGRRSVRAINQLNRFAHHVADELAQVRAPVLVLQGLRDRTVDPRCAQEIARRLVNSARVEVRLLPRSGHGISVDVDRDSVNAHIAAWFEDATTARLSAASG